MTEHVITNTCVELVTKHYSSLDCGLQGLTACALWVNIGVLEERAALVFS